jgi:hypothetical protein
VKQLLPSPKAVENALRAAVKNGVEADFASGPWGSGPKPTLDAALVRELVVGPVAKAGVRIRHARIEGLLNLADARGESGDPCNALILRECDLDGAGNGADPGAPGIDGSHGHLQRLSLYDCTADGVELTGAEIVGDLTLDGLAPRREDGACWVKACGARIGGTVTARGAKLRLPASLLEGPSDTPWPPSSARYWRTVTRPNALDLSNAHISGSLILRPGFASRGGVSISVAAIGGWLDARGAQIEAARIGDSTEALFAPFARIQGPVFLGADRGPTGPARFIATGALQFHGAEIGGPVEFFGPEVISGDDEHALNLYSASLSSDLVVGPAIGTAWESKIPSIDLSTARIGGGLYVDAPADRSMALINAPTLTVGGGLSLSGTVARTDLSGSMIGGDIRIIGASASPIDTIDARGLRAHGSVVLSGSLVGTCDLSGSVVGGELALGTEDDPFSLEADGWHDPPKLRLVGADVGRALSVAPLSSRFQFPLDLEDADHEVHAADLLTYPGWRLAEASFVSPSHDDPSALVAMVVAFLYQSKGREIVVLDGDSNRIHEFNDMHELVLDTAEQVRQYLSLFCNYVWTAKGAFRLAGDAVVSPNPDSQVIDFATREFGRPPQEESWQATCEVEYASELWTATFLIEPSGAVVMTESTFRKKLEEQVGIVYQPPFRLLRVESWKEHGRHLPVEPPASFDFDPVRSGPRPPWWKRPFGKLVERNVFREGRLYREELIRALRYDLVERSPEIDLRRLKVHCLIDEDGKNWNARWSTGGPQLRLNGFEYGRIDDPPAQPRIRSASGLPPKDLPEPTRPIDPRQRVLDRCQWLDAQYRTNPPTAKDYRPQPYQQLARVWRGSGDFEAADDIALQKLELEKVRLTRTGLSRWKRIRHRVSQPLWHWFIQVPFGFGLRPWRALFTFLLFWFAGVAAMFALTGVLKIDASAVATVVANTGSGQQVVVQEQETRSPQEEVACGDHISKVIYPLDVMIPLLDLRQESRCQLSINSGWWVLDWGLVKGVYAVVGWLVLSGLILTLSGVVRRRVEA